jgi:polysaccharide pyruvyl transferase WcaK-like protein
VIFVLRWVEEALEREDAFIIVGGDTALLLEFAAHSLDTVTILVVALVASIFGVIGRKPSLVRELLAA